MKKIIKILACLAFACSMLIPLAGCGKDYTSEIKALQTQIQELKDTNAKIAELEALLAQLQSENDSLSSDNSALQAKIKSLQDEINKLKNQNDLFTGSPKFNYSITETIPYYVNGVKIFDFKITDFFFNDNATVIDYTLSFSQNYSENITTAIDVRLYDTDAELLYKFSYHDEGRLIYTSIHSGAKTILWLLYHDVPFANITATPTRVSNYG